MRGIFIAGELHREAADGGAFRCTAADGKAGALGGESTEEVIAAAAADDVKNASQTLETQSKVLGSQVTDFLTKIRAA